jgi:hypothetical protein
MRSFRKSPARVREAGEDLEMPPSVDQEIGSCIARAG